VYDFGDSGGGGDATISLERDTGSLSSFDAESCFVADARGLVQPDAGPYVPYDSSLFAAPDAADADAVQACPPGDTGGGVACRSPGCAVQACTGADTLISGTVYAPNGTLPLYDVQVYVPGAPLEPLPRGVSCDRCGAAVSGAPIATTLTDASGHFTLAHAPAGKNVPLVVQLGKWRRLTVIPEVLPCTETVLTDPNMTRLPKNQSEGSMPHIALTTGGCDYLGCMLPKVGIDPSEFGYESDGCSRAVNVYNGADPIFATGVSMNSLPATAADRLWSDPGRLATYDVGIFSCECSEALESKGGSAAAPEFGVVTNYLNAGGRIFTTDFQYTWYKYSPDPNLGTSSAGTEGLGFIGGGAPMLAAPISLETSFPKGRALADWLAMIERAHDCTNVATVNPSAVFGNVQALTTEALIWGSSTWEGVPGPRIFSVDTPARAEAAAQCGRGVHIDAHVNAGNSFMLGSEPATSGDVVGCNGAACYPATCTSPLSPAEAMFAFFFFDLSSCIQVETAPPQPPPTAPK
jgi:hypothetical protein